MFSCLKALLRFRLFVFVRFNEVTHRGSRIPQKRLVNPRRVGFGGSRSNNEGMVMDTEQTPASAPADMLRTMLQDGVDFEVTSKRKGKKTVRKFVVYPINLGTLLLISKIIGNMKGVDLKDGQDMFATGIGAVAENKDRLIDVVVQGILNHRITSPIDIYRRWEMRRYFDRNLSSRELLQVIHLIIAQMDVTDFLASIVSVKRMDLAGAINVNPEIPSTTGKSSAA